MIYLGRKICSYAKDGTCEFPPDACRTCKIEPEDSAFHRRLVIGSMTWEDVERGQARFFGVKPKG